MYKVNHGGLYVPVAREFLNRSDFITIFKQMGSEEMLKA